jgi:hypothetical protein
VGRALANKGHDTRVIQGWLGHRSITSTAVYTALAPMRSARSGSPDDPDDWVVYLGPVTSIDDKSGNDQE